MTKAKPPAKTGEKQDTRFKPGKSGNPKGRPLGSRNEATLTLEKVLVDDCGDVVRKVIAKAKEGDMTAARLVLERAVPVRKGRLVQFDLPPIESTGDVVKGMSAIIQAAAGGEITPGEAAILSDVLEHKRRALEMVEFEARLAALEQKAAAA